MGVSIRFSGDQVKAASVVGFAKGRLAEVKRLMSFQGLKVLSNTFLYGDIKINCSSCFGSDIINIFAPFEKVENELSFVIPKGKGIIYLSFIDEAYIPYYTGEVLTASGSQYDKMRLYDYGLQYFSYYNTGIEYAGTVLCPLFGNAGNLCWANWFNNYNYYTDYDYTSIYSYRYWWNYGRYDVFGITDYNTIRGKEFCIYIPTGYPRENGLNISMQNVEEKWTSEVMINAYNALTEQIDPEYVFIIVDRSGSMEWNSPAFQKANTDLLTHIRSTTSAVIRQNYFSNQQWLTNLTWLLQRERGI